MFSTMLLAMERPLLCDTFSTHFVFFKTAPVTVCKLVSGTQDLVPKWTTTLALTHLLAMPQQPNVNIVSSSPALTFRIGRVDSNERFFDLRQLPRT